MLTQPRRNAVKEKLRAGEPAYIMCVRQSRTVEIVGSTIASGHDGFYIDLQHSTITEDEAAQMCYAARLAGTVPLVRLPGLNADIGQHMLEAGAQGIIAPDVTSAEEARRLVSICRFPPDGDRAPIAMGPETGFQPPDQSCREQVQDSTLVIAMLERESAIDAAAEIASVPGIDALFVGSNDLTSSMGMHGEYEHPRVRKAYATAIAAARDNGKWLFVGGIRNGEIVRRYVEAGASRFHVTGMDGQFLVAGASRALREFEAFFE